MVVLKLPPIGARGVTCTFSWAQELWPPAASTTRTLLGFFRLCCLRCSWRAGPLAASRRCCPSRNCTHHPSVSSPEANEFVGDDGGCYLPKSGRNWLLLRRNWSRPIHYFEANLGSSDAVESNMPRDAKSVGAKRDRSAIDGKLFAWRSAAAIFYGALIQITTFKYRTGLREWILCYDFMRKTKEISFWSRVGRFWQ